MARHSTRAAVAESTGTTEVETVVAASTTVVDWAVATAARVKKTAEARILAVVCFVLD